MRTTVDLPDSVHRRALELAASRGQSLSATVADLTARGLAELGQPLVVRTDAVSGFPVLSVGGRQISSEDVADLLDED